MENPFCMPCGLLLISRNTTSRSHGVRCNRAVGPAGPQGLSSQSAHSMPTDKKFESLSSFTWDLRNTLKSVMGKTLAFQQTFTLQLLTVAKLLKSARLHLMEDSMDMYPLRPQNFLSICELKADKDHHFKVDNDENKHQLSGRMAKAEGMNYEGSPIKVTRATLKMSVQPIISLQDFEMTQAVVLRLKCGSGSVHISVQHLVAVVEDAGSEAEDQEDYKEKLKLDEDDENDNKDDEDDKVDEDDDFDEEEAEEKKVPGKQSSRKQNKTPKTPKGPSSAEYIKAKMQGSIEKGGSRPKVEAKFINYG
ncbi:hypothetical protein U0070_017153, partial [Myodes glareolus]